MVVHILSLAFTAGMLYLSAPGSDLFSWHPTCMTVAFVLLMLQAIVVFSPESTLFPTTPRADKVQLHWILNLFAVLSAAFGFGVIYVSKEVAERKHFVSWHGKFGLATCVGMLGVVLGGVLAKYAVSLKNYIRPTNMKLYHATGGMLVFVLAMVTFVLATYSNWFKKRVDGWPARICMYVPLVLAVCVARQVTQSYLPRVMTPRESELDAKARIVQEKIDAKLKKGKKAE